MIFAFLSSTFISVCSCVALSLLESDSPVLVLLHFPLSEVCHCEWPFLSPCQKGMSCILLCGRWDPSMDYFLDFIFCQHKFRLEITNVRTSKENNSLTLPSLLFLRPQSLSLLCLMKQLGHCSPYFWKVASRWSCCICCYTVHWWEKAVGSI